MRPSCHSQSRPCKSTIQDDVLIQYYISHSCGIRNTPSPYPSFFMNQHHDRCGAKWCNRKGTPNKPQPKRLSLTQRLCYREALDCTCMLCKKRTLVTPAPEIRSLIKQRYDGYRVLILKVAVTKNPSTLTSSPLQLRKARSQRALPKSPAGAEKMISQELLLGCKTQGLSLWSM